jgi:hypothetical protein
MLKLKRALTEARLYPQQKVLERVEATESLVRCVGPLCESLLTDKSKTWMEHNKTHIIPIVRDIMNKRLFVSRRVWKELLERIRPRGAVAVEKVISESYNGKSFISEVKFCTE